MPDPIRSTLQKRDAQGRIRHGGEWLALWSDPDSLKSAAEKRSDRAESKQRDEMQMRIHASARSLSGDPDFALETPAAGDRSAPVDLAADRAARAAARGAADAQAALVRYHDPVLHARLRPEDPDRARLFDLVEHARCHGLAARAYPGLVGNFTAQHLARLRQFDLMNAHLASLIPLAEALRMVLRDSYAQLPEPSIQTAGFRMWDRWLRDRFNRPLGAMSAAAGDQAAHAEAARGFLDALIAEFPSGGRQPRRLKPSAPDDSAEGDDKTLRESDDPTAAALFSPSDDIGETPEPEFATDTVRKRPPPYRPYTTAHDRIVDAGDLFDPAELTASRKALDQKRAAYRREVARLAARLQRRLLAQQDRQWMFDLDEGLIDASRLDQVVLSPGFTSAYKQESESPFRDTLVTLLIDNSGSMRGKPIETACITADIVAAALERCSISTEILGFTTAAWNGGASAKEWKAAGRPEAPGRLNDLLHIVYKSPDTPLRRARDMLSAMLSPALLKENVDGEALIWAADRMLRRPEARKFLIVISDGAPVDKATIDANDDKALLDRHLRGAIGWITRETPIDLAAIGLKHEVAEYYRNSVRIDNVEDLATTVISLIDTALVSR